MFHTAFTATRHFSLSWARSVQSVPPPTRSRSVLILSSHLRMSCQWSLSNRFLRQNLPSWSCSQAVSKPVWHIPLLCVQWKTPDDVQRNCPKHVEFYSKNKFKKRVHLVGFIIRFITIHCPRTSNASYVLLFHILINISHFRKSLR